MTEGKKRWIYVAGPYTGDTVVNVQNAIEAGMHCAMLASFPSSRIWHISSISSLRGTIDFGWSGTPTCSRGAIASCVSPALYRRS
jgi:hypothetical protein